MPCPIVYRTLPGGLIRRPPDEPLAAENARTRHPGYTDNISTGYPFVPPALASVGNVSRPERDGSPSTNRESRRSSRVPERSQLRAPAAFPNEANRAPAASPNE